MVYIFQICGDPEKPNAYGVSVWKYVKHNQTWPGEKGTDTGMRIYLRRLWRIWAKALGEKSGNSDTEADLIACIRSLIVLTYVITNFFIVAGVVRHWND